MKSLTTAMRAHLKGDEQSTALCWRIVKRDSTLILGTEHDRDIVIPSGPLAGTYKGLSNITPSNVQSNSDLSVDNLEVTGALQTTGTIKIDVTAADIEAGNFSYAVIKSFFVNWNDLTMGIVPIRSGVMGQVTYDSNGSYKTEVRGLAQILQQNIMRTHSDKCNVVRFGDSRCKFDVASVTIVATVTAVTNRRTFSVSGITTQAAGYFNLGNLVGLTGENTGFLQQIRVDNSGGTGGIILFEAFPNDVAIGDTFSMSPGCDRLWATCKNKYNNIANNKAYGLLVPGIDALLAGPAGQMTQGG